MEKLCKTKEEWRLGFIALTELNTPILENNFGDYLRNQFIICSSFQTNVLQNTNSLEPIRLYSSSYNCVILYQLVSG